MDYKEKVIALLNSKELSEEQKEKLGEIFPELTESEDERIRKELIEFVKSRGGFKQEYIAWLEKQVQKPAAWSEEDKNMLEWVIGYLDNRVLNAPISEERTACKNAIAWLEEKLKGEQKPADKVEPKFKVGDIVKDPYGDLYHITEIIDDSYKTDNGRFILFENQEVYTLSNFTAWSEEDDIMVHDIDYALRCQITYPKSKLSCMSSWIGSLKNRVQPKQEWSKEDEAFYQRLEQIVCKVDIEAFQGDRDLHSWLKSLRPQSQWKPSEQDILLLERIFDGKLDPRDFQASLQGVIEQLKKLKEE